MIETMASSSKPSLVLHFDVNKTLCFIDPAYVSGTCLSVCLSVCQDFSFSLFPYFVVHTFVLPLFSCAVPLLGSGGLSMEDVLNSIISLSAWGYCRPAASPASDSASASDGSAAGAGAGAGPGAGPGAGAGPGPGTAAAGAGAASVADEEAPAITWELASKELSHEPPEGLEPPPGAMLMTYTTFVKDMLYPYTVAEKTATKEQRTALQAHNRKQKAKQKALTNAFAQPGFAGHAFAPVYEQLVAAMRIPKELMHAATEASHVFKSGFRFVAPSYFATIAGLADAGRDFSIVFRTFGSDLPEVIAEHNLFCEGRHPLLPPRKFDGSDGGMDLRVHVPHATGRFLRHGHESSEFVLATTAVDSGVVDFVVGFDAVRKVLHTKLQRCVSVSLPVSLPVPV